MIKRLVTGLAVAIGSLATAGCGNPEGLFPVSGKVLYRGAPAKGAVVYFHAEGANGAARRPIPSGIVADDGSFSLISDNLGNGARPGLYSVLVDWRDATGNGVVPVKTQGKLGLIKRSRVRSGPDRLKGRYLDITKPLLHAEVKAESNQLASFELTD